MKTRAQDNDFILFIYVYFSYLLYFQLKIFRNLQNERTNVAMKK